MGGALKILDFVVDLKEDMYGKYGFDSLSFVTLPLYLWECALKITGIELELLTDINMFFDYKNRIRGGISRVIRHFLEASNKNMPDYD